MVKQKLIMNGLSNYLFMTYKNKKNKGKQLLPFIYYSYTIFVANVAIFLCNNCFSSGVAS